MVNFNPIILRGFSVQGYYNNMVWKINLLAEDMSNKDYKNYQAESAKKNPTEREWSG